MNNYEKLYLLVLDDFDKNYSHLRNKNVKISDLKKQSNDFKKIKTDVQFRKELIKKLNQFKDVHIKIMKRGDPRSISFKKRKANNFDEKILKKYFKKFIFENDSVKIAKKGKILYLLIKTWRGNKQIEIDKAGHYFDKLLRSKKFDKIIFDVRMNGGGNSSLAMKYLRLLIKKDKVIPIYKVRYTLNKAPEFEKLFTNKTKGTLGFNGKIIALTGQRCCISTELFLVGLREIGATLIGDRTMGGSGNPVIHRYGIVAVGIPSWISYTMQDEVMEDNPIQPDIKIPSSKSIVKGKDLVLEKALLL